MNLQTELRKLEEEVAALMKIKKRLEENIKTRPVIIHVTSEDNRDRHLQKLKTQMQYLREETGRLSNDIATLKIEQGKYTGSQQLLWEVMHQIVEKEKQITAREQQIAALEEQISAQMTKRKEQGKPENINEARLKQLRLGHHIEHYRREILRLKFDVAAWSRLAETYQYNSQDPTISLLLSATTREIAVTEKRILATEQLITAIEELSVTGIEKQIAVYNGMILTFKNAIEWLRSAKVPSSLDSRFLSLLEFIMLSGRQNTEKSTWKAIWKASD